MLTPTQPGPRKRTQPNVAMVFISYTNREDEIALIKPLVRLYIKGLWDWGQANGIDVFYDDFSMEKKKYSALQLATELGSAVTKSDLFTAFISRGYPGSSWCRYEWQLGPHKRNIDMRSLTSQQIYWKPDYHNYRNHFLDSGEVPGIISADTVVRDLDNSKMTRIFNQQYPSKISQDRLSEAIIESIKVIKARNSPHLQRR